MRIAFGLCTASLLLLGCRERSQVPSSPSSDNQLQAAVQPRLPCNSPRITASPLTVSRPHNTGPYNASFTVKNYCTTTVNVGELESARTGQVTSVCAPVPGVHGPLAPGASFTVIVAYNVGAVGTGTVVLRLAANPTVSGSQTVNVT